MPTYNLSNFATLSKQSVNEINVNTIRRAFLLGNRGKECQAFTGNYRSPKKKG